jgi:hypothetical protein
MVQERAIFQGLLGDFRCTEIHCKPIFRAQVIPALHFGSIRLYCSIALNS